MSQGKIGSHNRKKALPSFNQIVMEIRRKKMVEFFIDPEKEEEIIQKGTGLEEDGEEGPPKKISVCVRQIDPEKLAEGQRILENIKNNKDQKKAEEEAGYDASVQLSSNSTM
jgi:hypothetical protein